MLFQAWCDTSLPCWTSFEITTTDEQRKLTVDKPAHTIEKVGLQTVVKQPNMAGIKVAFETFLEKVDGRVNIVFGFPGLAG